LVPNPGREAANDLATTQLTESHISNSNPILTDSVADRFCDSKPNPHSDSHSQPKSKGNGHGDRDAHCDCDCDRDGNCDRDRDGDGGSAETIQRISPAS
jgi:hypothetical protein